MTINIRQANKKDVPNIMNLLSIVLEVHASIRPDIFISGTTKYTIEELEQIIDDPNKPIIVATNENDEVIGYGFCIYEYINQPSMFPSKIIYIDDICIDPAYQHQHVGTKIFEAIKQLAIDNNYDSITLNVWEGNDSAKHFYEKMGMKIRKTNMEIMLKK